MAKPELRSEARRLRKEEGKSVGEITKQLGVSKGSVSLWVRDIVLSDEQQNKLMQRSKKQNGGSWKGSQAVKAKHLETRREFQERGRKKIVNGASDLYKSGCTLYWAEGSKKRNTVVFVNSDVSMMKVFVMFLLKCFNIKKEDICLTINCYLNNGLTIEDIENYWLYELGELPRVCLRKHTIKYGDDSRRSNRLKYGICRVGVCRTEVVQEIYGAIQEMFNFTNSDWLEVKK